jgi:hypothetical protein
MKEEIIMTKETSLVLKELPKKGDLETFNLYLKNVPVFYPVVHEVKKKFQSEEKEFSVTVFIDEATKDKLEDEIAVNKTFAKVGVTKTSKPPKRIKYGLSSQVAEGKLSYDEVDGMWGFTVTRPEFSKKGNKQTINVIDKEGNAFTDNVGNGSVCNIKLFAYKNRDGQLVVSLDTVQVLEHVAYEGKSSSDEVVDDVLGSYKVKKVEAKVDEKQEPPTPKKAVPQPEPEDEIDQDLPF